MTVFFTLPDKPWEFPIRFFHVVGAFAIYLLIGLGGGMLFGRFTPSIQSICWLNFFVTLFALFFLALYLRFLPLARNILYNHPHPWSEDVQQGLKGLLFAFPVFLLTSYVLEWFITFVLHVEQLPDQLAVRFIKMTLDHPFYLTLTAFSLIFFVPLIEELLFRGFLQSWLRQHLGPSLAILLSSLCFSFFHYSHDQGLANLLVIGSLLPLALFLGFVYERQQSLLASITLHATFNTISIFNLYFFGA